jgi:hypothetical protein
MNIFFLLLFTIFVSGSVPVLAGPEDPITEGEVKILIEKALEPSLMSKIWDWKYSIGMTFGGVVIGGLLLKRAIRFENKINNEIQELEAIKSNAIKDIYGINTRIGSQNTDIIKSKNNVNVLASSFTGLGTIANQLHVIASQNQQIANKVSLQLEDDKKVISSKCSEFNEHARQSFVQVTEGMESANKIDHDKYTKFTSAYNESINQTIKNCDDFELATLNKFESEFQKLTNFKSGITAKTNQLRNLSEEIQKNLEQLGLENNDLAEVQKAIHEFQNLQTRVEASINTLTQRGNRILDLLNNYSSSDDESENIVRSRPQSPASRSGRQSPNNNFTIYNNLSMLAINPKKNDSEITGSTISTKSYNFNNDDELN